MQALNVLSFLKYHPINSNFIGLLLSGSREYVSLHASNIAILTIVITYSIDVGTSVSSRHAKLVQQNTDMHGHARVYFLST